MNTLTILIVTIGLLKGFELAWPAPARRSSSRRRRHAESPGDEEIGALLWQGLCHVIGEKAPWLFVLGNVLFYGAMLAAIWWFLTHLG